MSRTGRLVLVHLQQRHGHTAQGYTRQWDGAIAQMSHHANTPSSAPARQATGPASSGGEPACACSSQLAAGYGGAGWCSLGLVSSWPPQPTPMACSFLLALFSSTCLWLKVQAQVAARNDDGICRTRNALKVAHRALSLHLQRRAGHKEGNEVSGAPRSFAPPAKQEAAQDGEPRRVAHRDDRLLGAAALRKECSAVALQLQRNG